MKMFTEKSLLSTEEMDENSKWNIENGDMVTKGVSKASDSAYALLAAAAGAML